VRELNSCARSLQCFDWSSGVDLANGGPVRVPANETNQNVDTRNIWPSSSGAWDQQGAAFSPRTGLSYIPTTNRCIPRLGALGALTDVVTP
jgi:hypothetical protein